MAEKDISEKLLEDYPDVFADIVNVLLFQGEKVIQENELKETAGRSHYKADDSKLHEQERDVSKYWEKGRTRIAIVGLENQTGIDDDMPLRVINYDGVSYRSQLMQKDSTDRYPVMTIILYFGKGHWTGPKSLYEALDIPDKLKEYVNDYKIHVFEISDLPDETVKQFNSDFRIVADFFTRWRKDSNLRPENREIQHVDEMMKFLDVFSEDSRFTRTLEEMRSEGKEVKKMCDVLDRIEEKGRVEGLEEGRQKGFEEGKITVFKNMILSEFPINEAMSLAGITEEQAEQAMKEINKNG